MRTDGLNELRKYLGHSDDDARIALDRKVAKNLTKIRARDFMDKDIPYQLYFITKPTENTFILDLNFDTMPLIVGGLEDEPTVPPPSSPPPYVPPTPPGTSPPPTQPPTSPPPPPPPPPPPSSGGGTEGCTATIGPGGNLLNAINALPAGGTLCLTGNVGINAEVTLTNKDNWKLDGRGYTVYAGGYYIMLHLRSCNNVTLKDITLLGAHPRPGIWEGCHPSCVGEHAHGVSVRGGSNILLENVRLINNQGDGIYIVAFGTENPVGITTRNLTVQGNGRMALAVVSGRNIAFYNTRFHNIAYSLVDMEPDWNPSTQLNTIDNVLADGGLSTGWVGNFWDGLHGTKAFYIGTPYGAVSGKVAPSISNVIYRNFEVRDAKAGIFGTAHTHGGYRIRNVTFENNRGGTNELRHYYAFEANYVDGLIVRNNHQPLTDIGRRFLNTVSCTSVTDVGNTI